MCITSLGIYGFLVSAYQETAYKFENLENLVENYQTKQSRFETQLTATTNEKQAVNQNVQQLTAALSNNRIQYTDRNGNQIIKTSNENRKAYERQLEYSTTHLNELTQRESSLSDSITAIEMKITDLKTSSDVAAEIGPLKYISKITGKTMDTIVNWLIIALIIVFDPLAIMLLIVANKELNTSNTNAITQNIEVTEQVIKPEPPVKKKSEPQILSYWNRLRNERNAKYKK
jgi:prefoldin subunit 5